MTIIRMMTTLTARMICRRDDVMAGFTDSPYEYIMQQKPGSGKPVGEGGFQYPAEHKCHGCPYGRGRPCIGICMKKIYPGKRKK